MVYFSPQITSQHLLVVYSVAKISSRLLLYSGKFLRKKVFADLYEMNFMEKTLIDYL